MISLNDLVYFGLIWFERVSMAHQWFHETIYEWISSESECANERMNERMNEPKVIVNQQALLDLYIFIQAQFNAIEINV